MSVISLRNVSKSFGVIDAIQDLSLTIGEGEFVVLLGPTGAGKTTTLRLVAGLETPDRGTITIDGTDVTGFPPAARDTAFVFQQYSLYPHYSVFDNMAFPLRAPGRNMPESEIRERVGEIAEMLHISDKLDNRATELSGGEMQRVSIGRALVRRPRIYLMDEPLSSLDAKLREGLRVELKRIQRDLGASLLYVTHDQLEAMTMADRIGVLSEGRLVQLGTPREVYEKPANVHAARRLGSPQINLAAPAVFGLQNTAPAAKTAGVRPEDIDLRSKDGIPATVLTVEPLGAETIVLLESGGIHISALLGGEEQLHAGEEMRIAVRPENVIFFDQAGNRLAGNTGEDE
ncbi:MAG TPA: ABC transporter ATP-binding protein [Rhodobacteraceae bacterium]|nr:ABC transporter ATP-binding protein [Paracoccaceae bacterium]